MFYTIEELREFKFNQDMVFRMYQQLCILNGYIPNNKYEAYLGVKEEKCPTLKKKIRNKNQN